MQPQPKTQDQLNILATIHAIMYSQKSASSKPTGPIPIATANINHCRAEMELLGKIMPRKSALPILQNVKLTITPGKVLMHGTNLESTLLIDLPAETTGSAEFLIPFGKYFIADELFISVLPDNTILLNGVKFTNLRPAEEFPEMPEMAENGEFILTDSDLAALYSAREFCSHDELKPSMTGFYFDIGNRFVATDGYKLIVRSFSHPVNIKRQTEDSGEMTAILPATIAHYWPTIKKIVKSPIACTINHKYVMLRLSGQVSLIMRLIDERFPDYESVIPDPKDAKYYCSITANELRTMLKSIEPGFQNPDSKLQTIIFAGESITAHCHDRDEANQVFANPSVLQPPFTIALDYSYFSRIVNRYADNDEIRIYMYSPVNSVLFIRADENLNDETVLLMPVRIN